MDLTPMVSSLKILDKDVRVVRLTPNWAQQEYLAAIEEQFRTLGRVRFIVLKARQLGLSTVTEACAFCMGFVIDEYRSTVVAHEADAARNLLKMTKRYWKHSPWNTLYSMTSDTRNEMSWRETGSSIAIATAGKKGDAGVGRSGTNHFLHISEAAFYDDAETVMLGLTQTVPPAKGTMIVIESTANGTGNYFHRMWEEAEAGENEYIPLFFPWWRHPEYVAERYSLPIFKVTHFDEDEEKLLGLMRGAGQSPEECTSRLIWRRWAIKNLCAGNVLTFQQEYPADPEEAFLASGLNVFPADALKSCYEKLPGVNGFLFRNGEEVTFKPDPHGPLRLFKAVNPTAQYVIGGDPTRTLRGDFACAQIFNRHTLEQVGVWRGKTQPGTFGHELVALGYYFNRALLVPEITGPGQATLLQVMALGYPNMYRRRKEDRTRQSSTPLYGFETQHQTKHLAINTLLQTVVERSILFHDHPTYMEMRDYVTVEGGGIYGPSDEKHGHDDTVMASALAIVGHFTSPLPHAMVNPMDAIVQKMNNTEENDPYAAAY